MRSKEDIKGMLAQLQKIYPINPTEANKAMITLLEWILYTERQSWEAIPGEESLRDGSNNGL